ncbi:ribosome silencing factor [Bacteroidales bacterium OttesenSCG-928-I21]|nr:ribosome silencing factor [Bacteroidales bacterium OttesenSCG-928-I21]
MAKRVTESSTEQLLKTINESILEKKGETIINLNLENIENSITKYFVICSGTSNIHVNTIAQYIEHNVRNKLKERVWHKEGFENSEWILLDYVDVVVHIFQPEARAFYRLEQLWADAKTETIESI